MIPEINIATDPRVIGNPHPMKVSFTPELAYLYLLEIEQGSKYVHVLRIKFAEGLIKEAKWESDTKDPNGGLDDAVFRLRTAWTRYRKNI